MIKKWQFKRIACLKITVITVLIAMLPVSYTQAQEPPPAPPDSLEDLTIPPERIPVVSGETGLKIIRLNESIISSGQIEQEKIRNDSILSIIDSLLAQERTLDVQALSNRNLLNKKTFWNNYQEQLERQERRLTGIIDNLKEQKSTIDAELQLWSNTKAGIDSTVTDSTLIDVADDLILLADSTSQVIVDKTNEVISLLNSITRSDVEIESLLEKIDATINQRQGEVFSKTHPSFFEIDYDASYNWDLQEHLDYFYEKDINALISYYQDHTTRFYIYFIFLLLLIVLSLYIKRKIDEVEMQDTGVFQQSLRLILSKPVSIALTLWVFSSGLFFNNRPPIFEDIAILILGIAILTIIFNISNKESHKYLYVFGLLILLRFINYAFPPEILLHRIILLVSSVLEVFFLYSLIRHIDVINIRSKLFLNFIRLLVLFHLITAVIGGIANLTGQVQLAKIAVDAAITDTLVALLLLISAVTLVGVIQFAIDSNYLQKLTFVRKRTDYLKNQVARIIIFLATLMWIDSVLRIFSVSNPVYNFLGNLVNNEIAIGSITFTLGKVLLFLFVIWLSVIASQAIRTVLEDDVLNKVTLKKGVPRMITAVIRFSLITLGVFMAVSAVGLPISQLTIIFSAFSVGIGFGLQNIVNNFVSGVILLFERPVQLGDTVEVGTLIGVVKSMGIRSSNIKTFDGAEVIVPNGHLISNEVVNWTLSDKRRRIEIISGVAYGSDVDKVQQLLLDIITSHPDVLKTPSPMVLFNEMADSSLNFRLLFWTDNFDDWIRIKSEVVFMVYKTLNKEGINIPFPQRDLHIKSYDGAPAVLPIDGAQNKVNSD